MADEAEKVAEFDPASLIEESPATVAKDDKPDEKTEATETESESQKESDSVETSDAEPEKPREGTPDKALQKMQQELSTALREIEAIKSGKASPAAVEKAERKIDSIRKRLVDDFDVFDAGRDLAEAAIETDERLDRLERLEQDRRRRLEYEDNWAKAYAEFPEVEKSKLTELWQSTYDRHSKRMGDKADQQVIAEYATEEFRNQAKALNNQALAKKKPVKQPVKQAGVVETSSGPREVDTSGNAALENFKKLAIACLPDDE